MQCFDALGPEPTSVYQALPREVGERLAAQIANACIGSAEETRAIGGEILVYLIFPEAVSLDPAKVALESAAQVAAVIAWNVAHDAGGRSACIAVVAQP